MRIILLFALFFTLMPAAYAVPAGIVLTFAGDCTLGSDEHFGYEGTLPAVVDAHQGDLSYVFRSVSPIFYADDLTVVNLEGTLTAHGVRQPKTFAFRGPPVYALMLSVSGIEAVNLANNHTYDYGQEGFDDTLAALARENILYFGQQHLLRTTLRDIPVGLAGYLGFYADFDTKRNLAAAIGALKSEGRVVVVSFHWGVEGSYFPDVDQRELAHYAIDQGADAVIGHHPHVLQGIEFYKGHPVAYSLGNFAFGGNADPYDKRTMLLQLRITPGTVPSIAVRVLPARLSSVAEYNDYQPTLLTGDEKADFFQWFSTISPVKFTNDDWVNVSVD
ncbi:MAG: CapA family protein [Negativicutes bacterium]|nr:CapA family protein [Negativicutes bacterium]